MKQSIASDDIIRLMGMSLDTVVMYKEGVPYSAGRILEALHYQGIKTYVCGGSVRDALLKRSSKDLDVSFGARFAQLREAVKAVNGEEALVLFANEAFGVLSWGVRKGNHIDFNVLRNPGDCLLGEPRYTGDVWFRSSSDLHLDSQTRDFSFNALYYDIDGKVIYDPTERGIIDLFDRRLELVAHPNYQRIDCRLSFRIARFIMEGYSPAPSVHQYLATYFERDLAQLPQFWKPESFFVKAGDRQDAYASILAEIAAKHGAVASWDRFYRIVKLRLRLNPL